MKKIMIFIRLLSILSLIVFPFTFIMYISSLFGLDLSAFAFMLIYTSGMFAYEIVATRRGEGFIWRVVSKSVRDKIVFAVCFILLWAIVSIPLYLKMNFWWTILGMVVGYLVSSVIFRSFASQSMKEEFPKLRVKFRE